MASPTLARIAVAGLTAVVLTGCGARGPAQDAAVVSAGVSPAVTAGVTPAVPPSGSVPAATFAVPDISADLQSVDDAVQDVNGAVRQADAAASEGE